MNKKTRKLFTWCLVVTMVVTQMLFTNVAFAATRTSGDDRYKTAITISQKNFAKADTVVIARGDDAADALAASPVAYQKKAPILLTETATLTDGVLAEIQRLGAKNVIVAGGTGAVSANVESALKSAGSTVARVAGADRYATSLSLAQMLSGVSQVVVINGNSFADALSIAPIAAANGMAILSTDGKSMSADMTAFVGSKKVTIVGGTAAVSDSVASGATRLSGPDRYATNAAVINANVGSLKFAKVFFATGEDFPDALAGSVVAANNNSALVLVGSSLSSDMSTLLKSKATKDSEFVIFGGTGAVSSSVASAIDGVFNAPAPSGPVSVSSVKATAADTMEVAFSSVPADTSKVVFTVKRETTPMTVTASWNGSVATLKYSSKFPQGNYTVSVKNDATDLGTSNVTIDQEKVAKIEITTDKFAVESATQKGYFTYKVTNQYGEDITNKNVASINWTVPGADCNEGSTDAKGVIVAIAQQGGINFLNLQSITVTGVDTSANIVVTKSLTVAPSVGTLSNFKLMDVSNINNNPLQVGLSGEKWNVSFDAADLAGNKTDNFTLLNAGLYDQDNNTNNDEIVLSTSGYIQAKIVNQSGKGVIELTVVGADQLTTDVPVTVTAITKNGTTSTINLTLKKAKMPVSLTIMAPTEDVAYGNAKEVPFVCYDSDGNQLTKFEDIVAGSAVTGEPTKFTGTKLSSVSLSPVYTGIVNGVPTEGLYFVRRGDGTAKLMYQAPAAGNATTDISKTLTITTNSGKFSSVTINVRKSASASTLAVADTNIVSTRLAPNAYIRVKHQWFTAKDQYGRGMDLTPYDADATINPNLLYVKAELVGTDNKFEFAEGTTVSAGNTVVTNGLALQANGTALPAGTYAGPVGIADQDNHLYIHAMPGASGTQTIKFTLYKADGSDTGTAADVVATKTIDFTVVNTNDVTGITMDAAVKTDTIYNIYNESDASDYGLTANGNYKNGYKVFGTDISGNKVVLPKEENSQMFAAVNNQYMTTVYVNSNSSDISACDDYNKVWLAADADISTFDTGVTVSASLSPAVAGATTSVKTTSFTIKSAEDATIAKSITTPDEIDVNSYERRAVLSDVISVKDQFGKNMLASQNGSVQVYIDGALKNIVRLPMIYTGAGVGTDDSNLKRPVIVANGFNIYNTYKYSYGETIGNVNSSSIDPANLLISSLKGKTITIIANNGQSVTVTVKNN